MKAEKVIPLTSMSLSDAMSGAIQQRELGMKVPL